MIYLVHVFLYLIIGFVVTSLLERLWGDATEDFFVIMMLWPIMLVATVSIFLFGHTLNLFEFAGKIRKWLRGF